MEHQFISDSVSEYLKINGEDYIPLFNFLSEDAKAHIIDIGTSIMSHYWGIIKYESGSFIKNFLNNDLERTFASADDINSNAIKFYLMLKNNLEKPF